MPTVANLSGSPRPRVRGFLCIARAASTRAIVLQLNSASKIIAGRKVISPLYNCMTLTFDILAPERLATVGMYGHQSPCQVSCRFDLLLSENANTQDRC